MSERDAPAGGDGTWRRLDRRLVHETPFFKLHEDTVLTPTGRRSKYGVLTCGHCVGVLAFVNEHDVMMVRQHRYVTGCHTWEMPTGGARDGEDLRAAAQRELAEEAGMRAGKLRHVHTYHTSKSSVDETAHLFVGEELEPAFAPPDEDEHIERGVLAFKDVVDMVVRGEITDSMTVIAVLLVARERGL